MARRRFRFEARGPSDYQRVFGDMASQKIGALVLHEDTLLNANAAAIAGAAAAHHLPSCGFPEFALVGGLMAYGVNLPRARPPGRRVHRQDSQGRQARRSAARTRHEVHGHGQSPHGADAPPHDSALGAGAGRSGHRVTGRRLATLPALGVLRLRPSPLTPHRRLPA
jgi:hypothetical protein